MTLDNCEMQGQLLEDAARPVGLINETNFLSQQGDRALWFNIFYHSAYTSNAKEAKAFSLRRSPISTIQTKICTPENSNVSATAKSLQRINWRARVRSGAPS